MIKKLSSLFVLIGLLVVVAGCNRSKEEPKLEFFVNDKIQVENIFLKKAKSDDLYAYINKGQTLEVETDEDYELIYKFPYSVPVGKFQTNLKDFQISVSFDYQTWNDLNYSTEADYYMLNQNAKYLKLTIPQAQTTIEPIAFYYGEGYVVTEDEDLTSQFYRQEGWTGGDGIFSYPLTKDKSLFVFSDSLIGEVNMETNRRDFYQMIHNSYAIHEKNKGFDFFYRGIEEGFAETVFEPTTVIGYSAWNLVNGRGLDEELEQDAKHTTSGMGNMWLSGGHDQVELIFDLYQEKLVKSIQIWNYNETNTLFEDFINRGVQSFELYYSNDTKSWKLYDTLTLPLASGELSSADLTIDFMKTSRYIKIVPKSNHGGSEFDNQTLFGLSEVAFYDQNDVRIPTRVEASSTSNLLTEHEKTTVYWLQDGFVLDDKFYSFPIQVRNHPVTGFEVVDVNMIEVDIKNDNLNINSYTYHSTPLHVYQNDHNILFGAGVLNQAEVDGYIYVYGYIEAPNKQLVVSRVHKDVVTDFSQYEYFNGESFTKNIAEIQPIFDHVSAELSVTRLENGQYMLTIMKDTVSGEIGYALSDTPYGPFDNLNIIYKTNEKITPNTFTYNAKAHPVLSDDGEIIVSYNVNTHVGNEHDIASIYHPRFLKLIEVKHKK